MHCGELRRVSSVKSPQWQCYCENLFAAVACEIEGEHTINYLRVFPYFRVAQGANGIAVAALPVLFHRSARELVILGCPLVILGTVDQLDQIIDFLVRLQRE